MGHKKSNPKCSVIDCVNNVGKGCAVLVSNDFGGRTCPFFKEVVNNPIDQMKDTLEFYKNAYLKLLKDYEIVNKQYKQVRKEADDLIEAYEKLKS